jgi:hypothetical protein
MAVISGDGTSSDGLPFLFAVSIDHSGVPHGRFSGSVPGAPPSAIEGNATCASITGNIGVIGGLIDGSTVGFVVVVSDQPDGMIIGIGRDNCDTTGIGDPSTAPILEGRTHVIPEPPR